LLVASPANPTGTMLGRDELKALADWAAETGAWLISDEVYHRVTFAAPAHCALEFNDEAVVVNSFSKYYCMTGWRLGWMVVPERAAPRLEQLAQNFFLCPSRPAQYAALEVFGCSNELDARVAQYARNRQVMIDGLGAIGFPQIAPPDGAFYIYADAAPFTNDSVEFCRRMLLEAGVAAVPGTDFDSGEGQTFVRFSTAGTQADAEAAVERLATWLGAES
ncbi:MAG: aminotransferase class I/II-fold pyridoxal phosphate-dependent enzyme, partial [Alphaproteobacteria bacterium]|nr:aminotransferase class I/II-fold pyridoxal phosphate-dependent enzyme [Alphaproteobacteria bacterium]